MSHPINPALAYAELNLRLNPFGALLPEQRAALAIIDADITPYVRRLTRPGFALQLLGPSGRGKSTHLFAIRAHFPEQPYTYVPPGKAMPEIPDTAIQFIDEMQRVPRSQRLTILNRHTSFVIASHKNHRAEFAQAGLEQAIIKIGGITEKRLRLILERRVEWARRDPDLPVPTFSDRSIANLIAAFGDDLWSIEDFLYDRFQELHQIGEIQIEPPTLSRRLRKHVNAALTLVDGFRFQ